MPQLSYASLLGLPHHQLRAVSNTLPCIHFAVIHHMALVRSRMDRRAHNPVRAIQVSLSSRRPNFAMTRCAVYSRPCYFGTTTYVYSLTPAGCPMDGSDWSLSLSESSDTKPRSPTFLLGRDTKSRSLRVARDIVGPAKNTSPRGRITVGNAIGWSTSSQGFDISDRALGACFGWVRATFWLVPCTRSSSRFRSPLSLGE